MATVESKAEDDFEMYRLRMHSKIQSQNPNRAELTTPLEKSHSVEAGSLEAAVWTSRLLRKVPECGVVQVLGEASRIGLEVPAEQLQEELR